MKKITVFLVALLCLCLAGCAANGNLPYSTTLPVADGLAGAGSGLLLSGEGTQASPYLIDSAASLQALSEAVNGGNSFAGVYFRLTADIDLGGAAFTPIGAICGKASPVGQGFCGIFDGAGHTVSGFTVTVLRGGAYNAFPCGGLFGYIGAGAVVENLSVCGATVSVSSYFTAFGGALAGINEGTVKNCSAYQNTVTVQSTGNHAYGGGLVGHNYGWIEKTAVTGTLSVSATVKNYQAIGGGAVGQNNGTLKDTLAACAITLSANMARDALGGGVVAYNCANTQNLYIAEYTFFGGIGTLATVGDLQSTAFYTGKLGLDSSVWRLSAGKFPVPVQSTYAATAVPTSLESGCLGKPISLSSASAVATITPTKSYRLTKSLTLSGAFTPVDVFYGRLDGAGYTISGLSVSSVLGYVGLFGTNCGTVENLTVSSATIKATGANGAYGGIFAGESYGLFSKCHVSGTVTNTAKFMNVAGGICAVNRGGEVRDCTSSAVISCTGTVLGVYGGSLVGQNSGIVTRCHASGSVTTVCTLQYPTAGGLVGVNDGEISDSYATGAASATAWGELGRAGGLAGVNTGIVKGCYATGNVEAICYNGAAWAGSLVGDNHMGRIQNSFGCGNVSVTAAVSEGMLGGSLVGGVQAQTGTVTGGSYLQTLTVSRAADTEATVTKTSANTAGQGRASGSFTAATLGWSTDVWQFGGAYPTLK